MIRREYLLTIVFSFLIFNFSINILTCFAQEKKILTLEDAIEIALEKSYRMKSLRLSLIQANEKLKAARGKFRTNADLNFDIPNWQESVSEIQRQNELSVFNTTGSFKYQGSLNINQPLPTNGLLTLSSQVYHREIFTYNTDSSDNQKRRYMYSSISLNFSQPLFTVNTLKLGLKSANLNFECTILQYKKSELDIVYSVTQSFYDLYKSTRNLQIAQDNYKQQKELYEIAQQKYEAGLIPEVEALQMEVDLAESENNLMAVEANLTRTEEQFKRLIGLKLSDNIGVLVDFKFDIIKINLEKAIEMALSNRMEIRNAEIDIELAKDNIKEMKSEGRITGELSAFYDLTGVSDSDNFELSQLWNSTIEDMKNRPNNRGVVFSLSIPLWDWGVNAANIASAKASLTDKEMSLEEQKLDIVLEVRNAVGIINETKNRLEVLKKSQNVAERTFDISVQRFDLGEITSQELALDRNRYTQAKSSYLDAYIDYMLAVAELKKITMCEIEKVIEGM